MKSDLKVVYAQDVLDEKLKPFDFPAGEYEYTSTFGDVPQKATIKVDGSTLTVTHSDFGYSEWAEGKTYTLTENLQASTSQRRVYQLTGDTENMFLPLHLRYGKIGRGRENGGDGEWRGQNLR